MDDGLADLLASTVASLGLELLDVERRAAVVRVVVDRPGGVDLDAVADATRAVSEVLDGHDPFPGHRYTLEVSSPGVERPLRTPAHFVRAVGEVVSVRTAAGGEGERRLTGRLTGADDDGIVLEGDEVPGGERRLRYDEIERARTVFTWGATPPPGRRGGGAGASARPARPAPPRPATRKRVATS
ncbi:MAG TPA: ribosome maturation factor RimP [Acidimicrobiales bacterium]|nr:ribosome maturation factor RimP [Acidimicrobiales bacterium]